MIKVKVMSYECEKEGGTVPEAEVREDQRMYGPFYLGSNKTNLLLI